MRYINRRGPTTVQETTGTSGDANNRDARTVETTITEENNSRDARNVGTNSTLGRKYINSRSHGGNSRYFVHSRSSWDVNSSKNNNSSRYASNSRDHYNSWDPRKANGRNNVGHSSQWQQQGQQDYYGTLTTAGCSQQ
jgi:hypothetical protein